MKRLTLLLIVLGLIAGYPVFGQNGSSTCLHQWIPQSKVFQRGYQKQMVRGFQCQFCARFLTSLPSQKARYWVTPTTSWVSNPRDRNISQLIVTGLEKLTQLRRLYLQNNPALTKAQIDQLQKALPNCKIYSNPTK